ncbi:MAG: DUF4914 family protein [Acidobacteria bacterium]|nr:DUF4914 family protein [Acidobacteriota bacterium]
MLESHWNEMPLPAELKEILAACPGFAVPRDRRTILDLALGGDGFHDVYEVAYDVPGMGRVVEATVTRCRNGLAINYTDPEMRRRDPDCMLVADEGPSDKERFIGRFGEPFDPLRRETFAWLSKQELILLPLYTGGREWGYEMLLVAPRNAAFFVGALADLQEMMSDEVVPLNFEPKAIIYLAPPFRHTHFEGKQIVVHNRHAALHEIFAFNLYPGPSAKKGVYGVLIHQGEKEGWLTAHASTVQVATPYDNVVTILHEGASGGGKSEMLEPIHREPDGQILMGRNLVTGEKRTLTLPRACALSPVSDDMALCHNSLQNSDGKLVVMDAENAWFLRFNHITHYGTDPYWEGLCCHPKEPLLMLNLDCRPQATCLIWEHIEDAPGQRCPNPRVIMPRRLVPNVVNDPVSVDIRSFGIRTPPCTLENPSFGIFGLLHILPPALAWLWLLVAPRGHANPSITDSDALNSEGVGSFWPFATGRRVTQANLLLRQIQATPRTRYVMIPNQHVGAWVTGFMPQWLTREYLARRGSARFRQDQIVPARCPELGYAMRTMQIEGTIVPHWFLEVQTQPEVGEEGYDLGAQMLREFFLRELPQFLEDDLDLLGKRIIECCLSGGSLEDYAALIPQDIYVRENDSLRMRRARSSGLVTVP